MEFMCSNCGEDCSMALVNGLTLSICSNCGDVHIQELQMHLRMDVTEAYNIAAPFKRTLFMHALAMKALYENWDIIYERMAWARFSLRSPHF